MNKALLLVCLTAPIFTIAQEQTDTTLMLQPVDLKVYFAKQALLSATTSLHNISKATIHQQSDQTLLTAMNTVSGIRMEERSPGSFRIAMRGSLIRSPFGIRNTKVYIDEFPLTDASGNTYINLLDPSALNAIMIIKGPDGSLFGANSGGIIKITPQGFGDIDNGIDINVNTGSFGLFNEQLGIQRKVGRDYQFAINQSFTRSNGYRENTGLNKKTLQTSHQWDYNVTSQIRLFALYTDLGYQTPGGLTLEQYNEDPKQARPKAGKIPGAVEQKAAIYNKTLYGGIAHTKLINKHLTHNISIFGSSTDFKNPFITNYEKRKESNIGLRTYLSYDGHVNRKVIQMQIGLEGMYGKNNIENFDNDKGVATAMQAHDKLDNQTWNFFYRAQMELLENWIAEGSIGLNTNTIKYEKYYPTTDDGNIHFNTQWMPRLASSYHLNNMAWRISYSKGYSPPTIAEVRSSTNEINTGLQPEQGNNYEIGYKVKSRNQRILLDVAAYSYTMQNGIMREVNDAGQEYFSNIGRMKQKSIEGSVWAKLLQNRHILRNLTYQGALTYNHYRFGEGESNGSNITGNRITAVPDWTWTNALSIDFPLDFSLNIFHNYTSTIPLNDSNTVFSKKYNLVQTKASWKTHVYKKIILDIYVGIDNLLNEKYSLGNDINAFGGRYFNAAPTRNYYLGFKTNFK